MHDYFAIDEARVTPGMRVLMVDDNTTLLRAMSRMLGRFMELDTAADADEALGRFAEEGPYPVVITDQRMPRMSGAELINRLAEIAPTTVCLIMSGNVNDDPVIESLDSGRAFRVIAKPSGTAEIVEAVQQAYARHQELEQASRQEEPACR